MSETELGEKRRWTFFGVVLPERVPLTWGEPIGGNAHSPILNLDFEFRVVIHASQIIIDLWLDKIEVDLPSLRNIAATSAQILTDIVGYKQACCFSVEIVSAVCCETNDWTVFGIDIPALSATRKGQPSEIDGQLVQAVVGSAAAQIALSDFTNAMRFPIGTGFHCYRAIEAMMQSMKENEKDDDGVAWLRLRANLRIDRAAIDAVKAHADMPRHGKPSGMTDADRVKVFKISDEIIRRFLAYIVSGRRPLPTEQFPVLQASST